MDDKAPERPYLSSESSVQKMMELVQTVRKRSPSSSSSSSSSSSDDDERRLPGREACPHGCGRFFKPGHGMTLHINKCPMRACGVVQGDKPPKKRAAREPDRFASKRHCPDEEEEEVGKKLVPIVASPTKSKLEERWLKFFQKNEIEHSFESISLQITMPDGRAAVYTPDIWIRLGDAEYLVEIKPARPTPADWQRSAAAAKAMARMGMFHCMVCGEPVAPLCPPEVSAQHAERYRSRYETLLFNKDGTVTWNAFFHKTQDGVRFSVDPAHFFDTQLVY